MPAFPTPASSSAIESSSGGVFQADPANLPEPPSDATAAFVRDGTGRIRAVTWVVPEDAGDEFNERMWQWYELLCQRPDITPASGRPHLQLVRPA